jgi:anti-sigma-K factor RskA
VLPPKPTPELLTYVALLADDKAQPILMASASGDGQVRIHLLRKPSVPAGKSLELWAVPQDGKPKSLGLLTEGEREIKLEQGRYPAQAPVLAVSLEPTGGSTNPDGLSGRVLYSGKWVPA